MQIFLTLTRRELAAYFVSITGYVIIAAAAFLIGASIFTVVGQLRSEPTMTPVTEIFYMTPFFWFILLLSTPVISMRLFAQEKFTGTFETLMTAPVTDLQVVLSKFSAASIFYALMWLPLLGCLLILRHYSPDASGVDAGTAGCTFLGIFLIGGLLISIGCFASALTRSQMVAAMMSTAAGYCLFMVSFLGTKMFAAGSWQARVVENFSLVNQMQNFARGTIDSRPVVFYLSLTIFFLFLTLRAVESRRWK